MSGGGSNLEKALKALNNFIRDHRDRDDYVDQKPALRDYAQKIALKALKAAKKSKQEKYLKTAKSARILANVLKSTARFKEQYPKKERDAKEAVDKESTFKKSSGDIKESISGGRTIEALQHRLDLYQKYSTFESENAKKLAELLKQTLEKEKSLIKRTTLENADAFQKDRPERLRTPTSVVLHLRPEDGRVSDKSSVMIVVAKDCCYGIDATIGKPLWRRSLGEDSRAFPLEWDGDPTSLLLFDTRYREVVKLNKLTGKLQWRQPLGRAEGNEKDEWRRGTEQMSKGMLVHDGLLYIPTESHNLYQLDLADGRIVAVLHFTQPIATVPTPVAGGKKLVVVGDKALLYTVAITPRMDCESVAYLGHRSGAVVTPLQPIGKLLLMCDNDRAGGCRLRVLNSTAKGEWLKELTPTDPKDQIRVAGTVFNPPVPAIRNQPVLRNNKLFVSSTGERVSVFTVSDDDRQQETKRDTQQFLSRVTSFRDQNKGNGPNYVVTGPNGQFWIASNRLRRYQLKTTTVVPFVPKKEPLFGRASQPPRLVGRFLYLASHRSATDSVTVTQTDKDTLQGDWRAVLGAEIKSWMIDPANKRIICINEEGQVYRLANDDIAGGGFALTSSARVWSQDAKDPPRIFSIGKNRIGVFTFGKSPSLTIINELGVVERTDRMDKPLQAAPVILPSGIVLPLEGRLKFIPTSAGGIVRDFQLKVGAGSQPRWTHLAALGNEIIAAHDGGAIIRIQIKTTAGRRGLVAAVTRQLESPLDRGFVVVGGKIVIADAAGNLQLLSPSTLQPMAPAIKLSVGDTGKVSQSLWTLNGRVYVETDQNRLRCFTVGRDLEEVWKERVSLNDGRGLAGPPQMSDGKLLIATRSGVIRLLDPETGIDTQKPFDLGERISHSPRPFGTGFIVPSVDGSLHRFSLSSAVAAGGQ
ncbi:MAG: PQQ-binding-like beta-propeller repeat protein, partial [Planctomycetes bacterium]|nr:PQQ-binding-like beta-propeller repeat protein [Planctomycetota bacterium]